MVGGAFCWSFIDPVLPGKPQRKTKNPLLPCFGEISDILPAHSNQRSAVRRGLHVGGLVEEGSREFFPSLASLGKVPVDTPDGHCPVLCFHTLGDKLTACLIKWPTVLTDGAGHYNEGLALYPL